MFNFKNLDEVTRGYMIEAIDDAEDSGNIYYSSRFNPKGKRLWVGLLREAAKNHNEHWLAYQLEAERTMKGFEQARKPKGGYTIKHTPHNASSTMAEGQFNRFYILGLCRRAREEGLSALEIYRAKEVTNARQASLELIGKQVPIKDIEAELFNVNNSLKSILVRPNSGISTKLP